MSIRDDEPKAAVALIEWIHAGVSRILILQRAIHPKDPWSGHLAFPGGRRDPSDEDLLHTCIREVQEECGFSLDVHHKVEALPVASAGRSHGMHTLVQPWHFCLKAEPEVLLDQREMQRYFWVKKEDLLKRESHGEFEPVPGRKMPCYFLNGIPLWGFTYGVLMDWLRSS